MPLTSAQLNEHYGRPKSFTPVQVQARLPWLPRLTNGTVQVVLAHPLIADLFVDRCHVAARRSDWVPRRIDSYVPRAYRNYFTDDGGKHVKPRGWQLGDEATSRHSWGLAFDFFETPADVYPPGGVWTPTNPVPKEFASAFTGAGWTWGRNWTRRDDPHIEYSAKPQTGPLQDLDEGYVDFLSGMVKQGDAGQDVRDLQYMLRAVGERVEPSGIFGPGTHGAVLSIQGAAGITVDGLVGPQTESAISTLLFVLRGDAVGIVDFAYSDVLARPPDAVGKAFWVDALRAPDALLVPDLWHALWTSDEAVRRRKLAAGPAPQPVPPNAVTQALQSVRGSAQAIIDKVDSI